MSVACPLLNDLNRQELMNAIEVTAAPAPRQRREEVIQLPFGLLGFERVKNYALLGLPDEEPFLRLRMLDDAQKAFLVVSPFLILPDYQPDISAEDVKFLGLTDPTDALIVNIVTLRPNGQATVNLKGPIVINCHSLIGKQVIPTNAARFALHHPLPVA